MMNKVQRNQTLDHANHGTSGAPQRPSSRIAPVCFHRLKRGPRSPHHQSAVAASALPAHSKTRLATPPLPQTPHRPGLAPLLLGLFAALVICVITPVQAAPPPNLLFFFMDDMRWDAAGFEGNTVITTPHMDTLASEGTLFENAFITSSICMVSRASVFMGQHMARHGITAFGQNLSAARWADSFPKRLRDAGYYLGFIGKHGLGNNFTGLYGTYHFDRGYNGQGSYFNMTIAGEPAGGRHLSVFMGDLTVGNQTSPYNTTGFLQAWSALPDPKPPFCLQISWKEPHVDDPQDVFTPDPAYDHLYVSDTVPRARTDSPEQFFSLPDFFRAANAAGTARWMNRFNTEQKYQDNVKKHHRLIHGVDVQIGRILQRLDELGARTNTVIVFSSDHGFFLGERQQAGKWYIPEESIRVPLIVTDPRLPASSKGRRVPELALNIDIPATLLDYAGVALPAAMQGRSLRPIVEGQPPADWRVDFLHDHPAVGGIVFASEGVRTRDFSYARYPQHGEAEQLFDVTLDPYQRTNLARDPRYAAVLEALRARTAQLKLEAQ